MYFIFVVRLPYFGSEIDVKTAKFDDEQTYIKFDERIELDKIPFKNADLWNRLFPIKKYN